MWGLSCASPRQAARARAEGPSRGGLSQPQPSHSSGWRWPWGGLGNAALGASQCLGSVRGAGSSHPPLLELGEGGRIQLAGCGCRGDSAGGDPAGRWVLSRSAGQTCGQRKVVRCCQAATLLVFGVRECGSAAFVLLRLFSNLSFGCGLLVSKVARSPNPAPTVIPVWHGCLSALQQLKTAMCV